MRIERSVCLLLRMTKVSKIEPRLEERQDNEAEKHISAGKNAILLMMTVLRQTFCAQTFPVP